MYRGKQGVDRQRVRAGTRTGLRRAGEARRGPRAKQGIFTARQPHVAVIPRVHPGTQHVGDGHTIRAGALAVVTGVAAIGRPLHLRITLQERQVVVCRRPPTRGAQVLINAGSDWS